MENKRSILIVDDDVDASQMAKMVLEKTGLYKVSVCNCGSEAFQIIQNTRPDLVLLDVVMPDADGTEIADQIRNDKSLEATRFIFMTSLIAPEEASGNSIIGGHPFISKPVTAEILLKRVKGFFEVGH
jgi:PleD family two-component response regulator